MSHHTATMSCLFVCVALVAHVHWSQGAALILLLEAAYCSQPGPEWKNYCHVTISRNATVYLVTPKSNCVRGYIIRQVEY